MKNIDITPSVMQKVTTFEKRRSTWWFIKFIGMLVGLISFLGILICGIYQVFFDRQTFSLFTLFIEDPEIIADFWMDTLTVIWEEAPQEEIVLAATVFLIIIFIYLLTGHRRAIIKKRLRQLAKYK